MGCSTINHQFWSTPMAMENPVLQNCTIWKLENFGYVHHYRMDRWKHVPIDPIIFHPCLLENVSICPIRCPDPVAMVGCTPRCRMTCPAWELRRKIVLHTTRYGNLKIYIYIHTRIMYIICVCAYVYIYICIWLYIYIYSYIHTSYHIGTIENMIWYHYWAGQTNLAIE